MVRLVRTAHFTQGSFGRGFNGWRGVAMCGGGQRASPRKTCRCNRERGWRESTSHCRPVRRMIKRVILITGANGGLGQAMARSFLEESPENFLWLGVITRRDHAETLIAKFPQHCQC